MVKPMNEQGTVVANGCVGPNLYIMEVEAPAIARTIGPGQFVHMKIPHMEGHILRRPFSVYAADAEAGMLEILYQAVGFGTRHMAGLGEREAVELIGPVGRSWTPPADARRALLVAGGVGAAPLFMLAQSLVGNGVACDVVLGAGTKDALVCHGRYLDLLGGVLEDSALHCATDDGSFGRAGFCTALVEEALGSHAYGYMAVCGPEPMMRIAAGLAQGAGVPCQVSLERRMACGIGACLSCVVETREGNKRACVDGPVFDAGEVVFG